MSSILDSLRKSDQQRKNKNNNGIDSFKLNSAARKHSPWPKRLMWLILLIALAASAAWSWKNGLFDDWLNNDNTDQMQITQDSTTQLSDSETAAELKAQVNDEDQANNNTLTGRPDSEKVRNELKQNVLAERMQKAAESKNNMAMPEQLSATEDEAISLQRQAESTIQTTSDSSLPAAQTPKIETKKPFTSRHRQKDDSRNYKYLYELPFAIRKNLPPVRLNIHIYDKNPEDRMAVINGLRFNVGDVVEEIVRIEDITQEGVLLEFEGQLFMIPK